jgi:putative membrane protein
VDRVEHCIAIKSNAAVGLPLLACLVAGVFLLQACDRVDYRPVEGDSIQSGWASPERPSGLPRQTDQQAFLQNAAEAALFEIEASRIAIIKGGSPAVRRFAEAMLRDRIAADTDLQQLADSVGVALPSRMSEERHARLRVLAELAGNDFDLAYARNVGILAQQEALEQFERAADRNGARVQRFAADQIPALRKHLEWARQLASELDRTNMA